MAISFKERIAGLYPSRLDEDIPDNDKEKAYQMGYEDAIADVLQQINEEKADLGGRE